MKILRLIPPVCGIYIIINKLTKDVYIGSSVNMQKRFHAHKSYLTRGNHCNQILQRSYLKYGPGNFYFDILELVDKHLIIKREQYWIDEIQSIFNIRLFAENNLGMIVSEQTRKNMSASKKGMPQSEAQKANMHRLHKNRIGKPVTGKVKESLKLGPLACIGKPVSQETRNKIALSKIGRKLDKITRKLI